MLNNPSGGQLQSFNLQQIEKFMEILLFYRYFSSSRGINASGLFGCHDSNNNGLMVYDTSSNFHEIEWDYVESITRDKMRQLTLLYEVYIIILAKKMNTLKQLGKG